MIHKYVLFYNINYILLNFVVIDYLTVGMVMLFSYALLFFLCVLISRIPKRKNS